MSREFEVVKGRTAVRAHTLGTVEPRRTTTTQTVLLQCFYGLDLDVFISSETSEVIASEVHDGLSICELGLRSSGSSYDGDGS